MINSIPCLRQKSRKTYPGWPHVPIKPLQGSTPRAVHTLYNPPPTPPPAQIVDFSSVRVVKDIFVTRDRPFYFPVKCEMAIFFLVKRDFAKLFSVNRDFHDVFFYFRQPLLRNKWYCVTMALRLIPFATTWLVWFSVTFGQPSSSSCFVYFDIKSIHAMSEMTWLSTCFFFNRR